MENPALKYKGAFTGNFVLIRTARSLAINPKDPPTWSVLAGHSHTVSDSIKIGRASCRERV